MLLIKSSGEIFFSVCHEGCVREKKKKKIWPCLEFELVESNDKRFSISRN